MSPLPRSLALAGAVTLASVLAPPALAAQQDTTPRDTTAAADTGVRAVDTSGYQAAAPQTRTDTAAAPAAAPAPADTARRVGVDPPHQRGITTTRDTTTPEGPVGDAIRATRPPAPAAAPATSDTAARGVTTTVVDTMPEAECRALVRRLAAGGEAPVEASGVLTQTWVLPEGDPPSDAGGPVLLRFQVDETGAPVERTLVVEGTKDAAFRQRAAEAVRRMQFRPAMVKDCAIPTTIELPLNYPPARR